MKPYIFIFEGIDNIGKSTLIEKFIHFPFETTFFTTIYRFNSQRMAEVLEQNSLGKLEGKNFYTANQLLHEHSVKFIKENPDLIHIYDRSILGEAVYGYLYRHYDVFDKVYKALLELNEIGNVFLIGLVFTDSKSLRLLKLKKDTDYEWDTEKEYLRTSQRFIEVFSKLKRIKRLVFNLDFYSNLNDFQHDILLTLRNFLTRNLVYVPFLTGYKSQFALTTFPPVRNSCRNCYLFNHQYMLNFPSATAGMGYSKDLCIVGEAPGYKGCGYTGIPFYRDKSGMILREALLRLGVNPDLDVYITNLIHCTPPDNKFPDMYIPCMDRLPEEIKDCKTILATGKPYKFLIDKGFTNVKKLKHPAYYLYRGNSYKKAIELCTEEIENLLEGKEND